MALTWTPERTLFLDPYGRMRVGGVAFDNHYPGDVNGYATTAAEVGLRGTIFMILFQVAGLHVSYNPATGKVMCWNGISAHTHDLLLKNAAVADGATTRVNAGTNLLGANTGADLTVTGGGANGGIVVNAAVAALTEVAHTTNLAAYSGQYIAVGE
jgi:hypothetical protein